MPSTPCARSSTRSAWPRRRSRPPRTCRRSTEQWDAVLEARPAVASFVFGVPSADVVDAARARGIRLVGTATSVDEAVALEASGVDAIVATGLEAGGHRVSFLREPEQSLVGSISLIPQVVDAVSVPVIAAGGIADRRGRRRGARAGRGRRAGGHRVPAHPAVGDERRASGGDRQHRRARDGAHPRDERPARARRGQPGRARDRGMRHDRAVPGAELDRPASSARRPCARAAPTCSRCGWASRRRSRCTTTCATCTPSSRRACRADLTRCPATVAARSACQVALPQASRASSRRRLSRPHHVVTSTPCCSASASVHHSGAFESSAMRPPAASAAAMRASTWSCGTHTSTWMRPRPGRDPVGRLEEERRVAPQRVDEVRVVRRHVAEHRRPERGDLGGRRRGDGRLHDLQHRRVGLEAEIARRLGDATRPGRRRGRSGSGCRGSRASPRRPRGAGRRRGRAACGATSSAIAATSRAPCVYDVARKNACAPQYSTRQSSTPSAVVELLRQ